jgi:hypothetical protein
MENQPENEQPRTGLRFWRLLVCACCLASGLFVVWLNILPGPRRADVPTPNRIWGVGYAVVPLLIMALGHLPDELGRAVVKMALAGMIVLDVLILVLAVAVAVFGREVGFIVPTALVLAGAMGAHAGACYGVLKTIARRQVLRRDESL